MPEKDYWMYQKLTLLELGVQLLLLYSFQYKCQMLCMFLFSSRVYEDIVYEDYYKLVKVILKISLHKVHERC